MPFDPPGLFEEPDDASLVGFRSLMPPVEKKPSKAAALAKAPIRVLALPFKLLAAILRIPGKLFGGSQRSDA